MPFGLVLPSAASANIVSSSDSNWSAGRISQTNCASSSAILDEIGVPLGGDEERDYKATHARVVEARGESRVEELLAEGRSAPRDEIVAGALTT